MLYDKQLFIVLYHIGFFYNYFIYDYIMLPIIIGYIGGYLISHHLYHFYFSHKTYEDNTATKIFSIICVLFNGWATSPIEYSISHRQHHAFSDIEGDPHNPQILSFWKIFFMQYSKVNYKKSLMKDILKSKFQRQLRKYKLKIHLLFAFICFVIDPLIFLLIICPINVYWVWYIAFINYFGHKNGSPYNSKLLLLVGPWAWKHKDHHERL